MRILLASSNPHKLDEIRAVFDEQAGLPIELISLRDIRCDAPEPIEDGDTFEANAIKKARHYAAATRMLCLADDSGLEVDALNGEPGVRSARYAGVSGPRSVVDPANNKLLLAKLNDVLVEKRTARFVCAMALCQPSPPGRGWPASGGPGEGAPDNQDALRSETPSPQPSPGRGQEAAGRGGPSVSALVRGVVEGRILSPPETADPTQPHRGRGSNGFGYDPLFLILRLGKTTAELSSQEKNALSHRGQAARLMRQELMRLLPPG